MKNIFTGSISDTTLQLYPIIPSESQYKPANNPTTNNIGL